MRLRVLGCSGGSAPNRWPSSYLIDDVLAVDGGALTSALEQEEQEKVDHVLITHAHLDHVAQLPFLLDNRFARQRRPITFYASAPTIEDLRSSLFNNRVWPDFTQLRNRKSVALELREIHAGYAFQVAHLKVTPLSMEHPVPCFGFLVEDERAAVFIAGDTGCAESVRDFVTPLPKVKAVLIEVSWPNRMEELAHVTGHIVPSMLEKALPIHPTATLMVMHVKPFTYDDTVAELRALGSPLEILRDGQCFEW